MIRLTFVLRRKAGMSLAEFQKYWREVHGPLVAKHATTLNILRYVQVHSLEDPMNDQLASARGGMESPYDGVAELWWTNREAFSRRCRTRRTAGKELLEDEGRFIDLANSPLWFNYEYPQVNPTPEELVAREHSGLVKLFFCLRNTTNLSIDQAQLYWRTNHGPIIRGVASGMRLRRYLQVHRYEDDVEKQLRAGRKTAVDPYIGHAEAWFDRADLATIASTPEGQRAMEIAVADESNLSISSGRQCGSRRSACSSTGGNYTAQRAKSAPIAKPLTAAIVTWSSTRPSRASRGVRRAGAPRRFGRAELARPMAVSPMSARHDVDLAGEDDDARFLVVLQFVRDRDHLAEQLAAYRRYFRPPKWTVAIPPERSTAKFSYASRLPFDSGRSLWSVAPCFTWRRGIASVKAEAKA